MGEGESGGLLFNGYEVMVLIRDASSSNMLYSRGSTIGNEVLGTYKFVKRVNLRLSFLTILKESGEPQRDTRKLWEVMCMFIIWIMLMVT